MRGTTCLQGEERHTDVREKRHACRDQNERRRFKEEYSCSQFNLLPGGITEVKLNWFEKFLVEIYSRVRLNVPPIPKLYIYNPLVSNRTLSTELVTTIGTQWFLENVIGTGQDGGCVPVCRAQKL